MPKAAAITRRPARTRPRRRGRPPKYGQPGHVVSVTLPVEIIDTLRTIHGDIGWAIVTLTQDAQHGRRPTTLSGDAELVHVGNRQALIVVDPSIVRSLPGVRIVPFLERQALLALEPGRGMADLEVAVIDRLEGTGRLTERERTALTGLLAQLRKWRRDRRLTFETRSIVLVSLGR